MLTVGLRSRSTKQVYGVVDEAAHTAAGGLPVVRVAEAVIKAPVDDVALCWWQAGRRKARSRCVIAHNLPVFFC